MSEAEASIEEAEVTEYSITSLELLRAMLVATDILEKLARGDMTLAEARGVLEEQVASVIRKIEESARKTRRTKKTQSSRRRRRKA